MSFALTRGLILALDKVFHVFFNQEWLFAGLLKRSAKAADKKGAMAPSSCG
jgi:hypothetical protein